MSQYNKFSSLHSELFNCLELDYVNQLDIYDQLKSLYQYFDRCVFYDSDLENGQTYIIPMDVEIGYMELEDYEEFTNPDSNTYDPDLAPFVESHNKRIEDGFVFITLQAGTQFTFDGNRSNSGMILDIDGYPLEWYDYLIYEDDMGAVPYVIEV